MTAQRWLHIPIEITGRELYPKLFLATEAMKQGWACTLGGSKRALIDAADRIPPGVVYLKSVIPSELGNMQKFKDNGHRLVCLDEEGLVQSSLETLVTSRYCNETVALAERFFCWGDIQKDALQKQYPQDAEKFSTTGSPTADLWSPLSGRIYKEEIDSIKSRFGKYIMIPSSFGVPNHYMGPEEALKIMVRDNMFRDQADYDYYKAYHDYVGKVFERFLELFPVLSRAFPNHTIILRPHPSESWKQWEDAAKGLDNIKVIFEGPVSPWLLGADAILHWGSTTGIEAHMMGRPVVGYSPYPEEEKAFDVLPHLVSILTRTPDEAVAALRDVIADPANVRNYPDVVRGHEEMKRWIHNIESGPAVKNIMAALESMNVAPQENRSHQQKKFMMADAKEYLWRVLDAALGNSPLLPYLPDRLQLGLRSRAYGRQKSKQISLGDVKTALSRISDTPVTVDKIGKNLFMIRKQNP